jgi:hypothetical protein
MAQVKKLRIKKKIVKKREDGMPTTVISGNQSCGKT